MSPDRNFPQSDEEKNKIEQQIILIMEENGFVKSSIELYFHKKMDRSYFCCDVKSDKLSRIEPQDRPSIGFDFYITNGMVGVYVRANDGGIYSIEFIFNSIRDSVEDEVKRMLSYMPLFMNLIYLCKLKHITNSFPIPHIFTFASSVKVGFTGEDYNYGCIIKLDKHSPENTIITFSDIKCSRVSKEYNLYDLSEFVSAFNTDIFWTYHYFF